MSLLFKFFLNKLLSRPFKQIISIVSLKFSGVPLTQNLVSDVATHTFESRHGWNNVVLFSAHSSSSPPFPDTTLSSATH